MKRRDAIKLLGLSGGLASLSWSPARPGAIMAPPREPTAYIPGLPTWYATTCRECPAGCGMWVKTREGRPIKVEGNPEHPQNRGGLCARGQAALQGLYHPERFRGPRLRKNGELVPVSWDEAIKKIAGALRELPPAGKSERIAFISGAISGTNGRMIDEGLQALGAPKRIAWEPFGQNGMREANRLSFGRGEIPTWRIDRADLLFTFSADFLETGPSPVEHGRYLAEARAKWGRGVSRFIACSPRLDLVAANADEWVPIRPGSEGPLVMALVHTLANMSFTPSGIMVKLPPFLEASQGYSAEAVAKTTGIPAEQIRAWAKKFTVRQNRLVLGGSFLDAETWKAINLLNALVGSVNRNLRFGTGTGADWAGAAELEQLTARMEQGGVEVLLVAGANPAFTSPRPAAFAAAAAKVPLKVALAALPDETTELADLVLPVHHFLEDWGDYTARAGIAGLIQPARRPLYDTRPLGDILLAVAEKVGPEFRSALSAPDYLSAVQGFWQSAGAESWAEVRKRGGRFGDEPLTKVELAPEAFKVSLPAPAAAAGPAGLTLAAFPSGLLYDGRGSDRPWLRECPDPMSKIAWEHWAEVHPRTAERMGLESGELLQIASSSGQGLWPVWVTPGVHPEVVAVPLGTKAANVMPLLAGAGKGAFFTPVQVTATGRRQALAREQGSDSQEGRGLARDTFYRELHEDRLRWERQNRRGEPARRDLFPDYEYPEHHWGMVIDLDRCTGCSACVVACYAENNLPVVGREQVLNRREMSWLRLERYYEDRGGRVHALFVPMLCQHCDHAPCETVCPVYATYHTREGLNAQVYNRCVGTRYCSNNCPYKVRRFNWFTYSWPEPLPEQLNPEVTVREKGVMEKCSFCIQRIQAAKVQARLEGRPLWDGEIVPACAQSCPTGAIVFGDRKDLESRVVELARSPRAYRVLEVLNTRPAITYLKRGGRSG